MKPQLQFVLIVSLFAGILFGVHHTRASYPPEPAATLLYLPTAGLDQAPAEVTILAHVHGRDGAAIIAAADLARVPTLAASIPGLQTLEPLQQDAVYLLLYPLPGQPAIPAWPGVHLLLADPDWQLVRATPTAVQQLAGRGIPLQRITPDPKPWLAATAVPLAPADITPDPRIQAMMDQVISGTVYLYDGNLSGEWPVDVGGSPYTIVTRHTYSGDPIQKATQFVGEHLDTLGMAVEYHQWSGPTYPNVIGQITGLTQPDDIFIISAHLDDMPSGGVAPGADDNASGSVANLIAADIFSQYQWDCTLRFAFWTGEEQGLNGSQAYAQRAFNNGENIVSVLNLDMIAWNTPGSNPDIDLHATSSIPATLDQAQLFVDVINAYNLDLIPAINPNGTGASDHASFWQYGYTAILGIEDFADFNPYYHTTNDLLANLDIEYFTEFVRASVGAFAHMTSCLVPGGQGYLDGHVTAVAGGDPIAEATITMRSPEGYVFTSLSDGSGYYTRTLSSATYTVTAAAYGFQPVTVPGVVVITDTVTTQDFALTAALTHTVSGTVTAVDTGLPLPATVMFLDTPVSVGTDPGTGHYEATLPEGAYTMRVTAAGYQPEEREVTIDHDQTQDFALQPLPCVLLVDDDNDAPDVRPYYTTALDNLGVTYDVYQAGSGNGPTLADMAGYDIVIWFSGDKYGSAGPNSADEAALAAYLDGGGRLFLSSQDYLYDMDLTAFGQNYLGIGSYTNDSGGASMKYGVPGDPIGDGLGPFPLSYPPGFTDYGDVVEAGNGGSLAFRSSAAGGNGLDVDKTGSGWQTVFFGTSWVPLAHASAANGEAVLQRVLDWFGGCDCQPVQIVSVATAVNACVVDFDPDYTGGTPISWEWLFEHGDPATSQLENPTGIDFGLSGTYAYTVTAANCSQTASDTYTDWVTVACDSCVPLTDVQIAMTPAPPVVVGTPVTFTATLLPGTAVPPYSYTVSLNGDLLLSGQMNDPGPLSFMHTFSQAGLYTLTVAAQNCDLTAPVSRAVTVSVLPVEAPFVLHLPFVQRP